MKKMKSFKEIKEIINFHRKILEEEFKVKTVAIFGSYARGENTQESDLDVIVEFSSPVSLLHVVKVQNYLSDLLGMKVDLVPKENIRKELKEKILQEAVNL